MKKILIIDDDRGLIRLLKARLEENNFQVVTAEDGVSGLYRLRMDRPDLVILDIMMPQMDGYTFVEEMKNIKDVSPVPVIVLTVREGIHKLLDKKIVVEYIVKPYDEVVLLKKIKEHLKIN